jgi:hypothetical protein
MRPAARAVFLLGAALALFLISAPSAHSRTTAEGATARFAGPPADRYFGFAGVRQTGEPDPLTAATQVASVEGNMTRTAMHWQGLEPVRNRYDEGAFNRYKQLYDALILAGIKPIFMVQYAPVWARDPGPPVQCGAADACHYPPARSMLGEWRQFIAELASRFENAAIEVWNEPNYKGQWQPGPEPERYAELLAEARDAAHRVNPGMMVLSGGIAMAPKNDWMPGAAFLKRAYAASPSLRGNTDAVNFHIYPTADMGPGSSWAQAFADVRAVRAAAGDTATPLLVTETGVTTSGAGQVNEDVQAQRILAGLDRVFAMPDVMGALIYTLADRNEFPATDPERGFGVTRAFPGPLGLGSRVEPKLAYCGLRRATGGTLLDTDCPPETQITSGPPAIGPPGGVTFAFSSPDALTQGFQCSLDGAGFSACSSPISYDVVQPGTHRFEVRARGGLLNRVDEYPASWVFGIDRADRRLSVEVAPKRDRVRAGKKVSLLAEVTNPGAPLATTGVELCVAAPEKKVRLAGRECRRVEDISPGAVVQRAYSLRVRPGARRGSIDIRFEATADRTLRGKARARLKIR